MIAGSGDGFILIVGSRVLISAVAAAGAVVALAVVPAASADSCTIAVTLVTGQRLSFTLDVPPGTPVSSISLPIKLPVASVTESCAPAPVTGTTPSAPPPAASTTAASPAPRPTSRPRVQRPTRVRRSAAGAGSAPGSHRASRRGAHGGAMTTVPAAGASHAGSRAANSGSAGIPAASNPTFSFALPGPAQVGVPNFFIDSFRIPPFLLPIYQAAGIEYDVPWQVLAAINEIETNYGRNLSVSSAGAVGWMQFLPSTWKRWGVDANGDGKADPYNPADAIFSAGRYLQAAGAAKNLSRAIFAYNHAGWYVQSVLLRAQLIGGMPAGLIGALSGLVQGHFPVAAAARYADSGRATTAIFARQGAPVIAANDGKVVRVGRSARLGRYVVLQDATGNTYTYAQLGSVARIYAVPKPVRVTAADIAQELSRAVSHVAASVAPATAGVQRAVAGAVRAPITLPSLRPAASGASAPAGRAGAQGGVSPAPAATQPHAAQPAPLLKERLFANPHRPASYAAGGLRQLQSLTEVRSYFSDVLHLAPGQYTLAPLRAGAIVDAGTIIGHVGGSQAGMAPHMQFMIQPAGRGAPFIDPKSILDGWKLLEATAIYRAGGTDPFFGATAKNPTTGQVLLMSKQQLQTRVLADPHATIYACGRRDVAAGLIDRRILATIEFLTASGIDPTISGLECGHTANGSDGVDPAGATGASMDISRINGIPVQGHQGPGSITDLTIRRVLTLQGAMAPNEIVSLMSYKGQSSTVSLPDHAGRIQIAFTPLYGQNRAISAQIRQVLHPDQWIKLISRIGRIPEPDVPLTPSRFAIQTGH
jgi:hypothetical protein